MAMVASPWTIWLVVSGLSLDVINLFTEATTIGATHLALLEPLVMAHRLQNMANLLKAREALHCVSCPRQQASPVSNSCGGGQNTLVAAWSWEMRFFTLSGSRAKPIYKRSARGDMQLEVFGSSLNQSFQVCPHCTSVSTHQELAGTD